METIYITTHIFVLAAGILAGIYIASQIEKGIDKNINRDKDGR
tara:strand:- start:670 stop:798 length:129 start_codon:yes stop_codon:yes gene_type:complete